MLTDWRDKKTKVYSPNGTRATKKTSSTKKDIDLSHGTLEFYLEKVAN